MDDEEDDESEEDEDMLSLRPRGLSAEVELSRMLRGTFAKLSRRIVFIFDVSFLKFLL